MAPALSRLPRKFGIGAGTTTLTEPAFRWGRKDDRERIFLILTRAFQMLRGSSRWRQGREVVERRHDHFRVMILDRELVGIAHVNRHPLQIGADLIQLAYIGQVAVLPELQHRGLGSLLLRDLAQQLDHEEFDLARLSGLVRFYRQFGWVPFPRRFIEFPLHRLKAGTVELSVCDILQPGGRDLPPGGSIREYRPADRVSRDALQRRFHHCRTGAARSNRSEHSSPLNSEQPQNWRLVYEENGAILAYLATEVFSEDVSDFEASVNLREVVFSLDRPDVVIALVRHVLWNAHQRGAQRVTARFPWDERFFQTLLDAGLVFEKVELLNSVTGNMLRLMRLDRLLGKIVRELSRRWSSQHPPRERVGLLQLRIDEQEALLRLQPRQVEVVANPVSSEENVPTEAAWSIDLSQYRFLRLLLGLDALEALFPAPRSPAHRVLAALFPVQPTACTIWG